MITWRRRLAEHASLEPWLAASTLRDCVIGSPDPAAELTTLAEVANDPDLAPRQRALALLAVALATGETGLPLPQAALDAVESAEVVDAALAHGLGPALTGILGQAQGDASLNPTRRLVGRRMLALGDRGPHVTALLIAARDHDAAVRAAADDFVDAIQPVAARPDAQALAWMATFLGWLDDHPRTVFAPLCRELGRRGQGAPQALLQLLAARSRPDPVLLATVQGLMARKVGN